MAAQEDKLFEAKIEDCLRLGEKRPAFLGFLDLSERAYAEEYLRRVHAENYRFFGGFPEAERTVLGVFPDYMEPLDEEFPVTGLTVKFRRQDALSHRDFMGSFLAQGVVRASLGDILAEEGRAVLFVKTELAPHFLSQIDKIGRVGGADYEGLYRSAAAGAQLSADGWCGRFGTLRLLGCLFGGHRQGKSRADGARGSGFRQP